MNASLLYVLQCGKLYLGPKDAARVSGIDRAAKFLTRESAEERARALRGSGIFELPWEVVSLVVSKGNAP
jgi:hypothetical protein